jgi:histone acetyltransferase 1
VAFQKGSDFEAAMQAVPENWTPPGDKIASFPSRKDDSTMEIWKANLADPAVKQLVCRIQILVPFFIEGGTLLDVNEEDANRWTVYFLYCRKSDPNTSKEVYEFAGYCTVYSFYILQLPSPPASPAQNGSEQPAAKDDLDLGDGNYDLSQLPCRSRISQFLITPQYQGQGNGSRFYGELYNQYLKHPQTLELTVEDPNEAFDDMRDVCDLSCLRTRPDFQKLRINNGIKLPKNGLVPNNIVNPTEYDTIRRAVKIAPRQFARVVEMHLMSRLADSVRPGIDLEEEKKIKPKATKAEKHEYNLWKLLVKSRLYRQHKDILGQLDVAERIEKLEETVSSVEFEYVRLLALHENRSKHTELAADSKGKRKADEPAEKEGTTNKKTRVD